MDGTCGLSTGWIGDYGDELHMCRYVHAYMYVLLFSNVGNLLTLIKTNEIMSISQKASASPGHVKIFMFDR